MKYFTLFVLFSCSVLTAYAQENPNTSIEKAPTKSMETFNPPKNGTHGVYLGLGGGYANNGNLDFSTFIVRIAYVLDQKFEIGLEGQTFQSFSGFTLSDGSKGLLGGGVGGIHLKGIYFGKKRIHFSTPLFLGAGGVALVSHLSENIFDDFDPELVRASPLFVAEPGVNVEFNISKVLGLEIGAKYRFSHQSSFVGNQIEDMNGLMLGATLKVGYFDFGGRNKKMRAPKKSHSEEDGYRNY